MRHAAANPPAPPPSARQSVPGNIAQLLYVVRVLLEYGRHMAATLDSRATRPGFDIVARMFRYAIIPVIRAHLERGILRASALETALLQRAAAGRDVAISNPWAQSEFIMTAEDDPETGSLEAQTTRLMAERAAHDAPIDTLKAAAEEEIAAAVRGEPIGRTLAAIRRDLGVVPFYCTRAFWDALLLAMIRYEASTLECREDAPCRSERSAGARLADPTEDCPPEVTPAAAVRTPAPRMHAPGTHTMQIDALRPWLPKQSGNEPVRPHGVVSRAKRHAAASASATGPPLRAAATAALIC